MLVIHKVGYFGIISHNNSIPKSFDVFYRVLPRLMEQYLVCRIEPK